MQHDEFLGQVQHRGRMATRTDAERAARATLSTLAERVSEGAAGNLAAQLDPETARYMETRRSGSAGAPAETFGLDEFLSRVHRREEDRSGVHHREEGRGVDLAESVHHARAVISVLADAVSPGAVRHVLDQLPGEFGELFAAGSEGDMDL